MKKSTLIRWHLYAGLFTALYILAFGFSSLILNHGIELDQKKFIGEWETTLLLDTIPQENMALANRIRDQLQLMGWPLGWRMERDSSDFSFPLTNPGKEFLLEYHFHTGQVQVQEYRKSFWSVLHTMHFFGGEIPNAPFFIRTFAVYQYLGMLVLSISLVLGIWLWIKFSQRSWELYFFGSLAIISIVLMYLV